MFISQEIIYLKTFLLGIVAWQLFFSQHWKCHCTILWLLLLFCFFLDLAGSTICTFLKVFSSWLLFILFHLFLVFYNFNIMWAVIVFFFFFACLEFSGLLTLWIGSFHHFLAMIFFQIFPVPYQFSLFSKILDVHIIYLSP